MKAQMAHHPKPMNWPFLVFWGGYLALVVGFGCVALL